MPPPDPYLALAVALALGLLVGLQRERVQNPLAGIRTFALIGLLGGVAGVLAHSWGGWTIPVLGVALALVLLVGNLTEMQTRVVEQGVTTEVAALVVFAVGALAATGPIEAAVMVGGVTALLLHFKEPMHAFVRTIGEKDVRAMMQFVLIALVIFPVLPDRSFGPWDSLNPFDIWRVVVLIVGISLAGYVLTKLVGATGGLLLGGFLGGMVSSTATTVSYARRARESQKGYHLFAVIIAAASTTSILRVLLALGIVAPGALAEVAGPLAIVLGAKALGTGILFLLGTKETIEIQEPRNPAELQVALIFGAVYAVVVLVLTGVRRYLGDQALYGVALVGGLTDVDAITLSTGRMLQEHSLEPSVAWRLVLLAVLANVVGKWLLAGLLGHPRLAKFLALPFLAALAVGAAVLVWYP